MLYFQLNIFIGALALLNPDVVVDGMAVWAVLVVSRLARRMSCRQKDVLTAKMHGKVTLPTRFREITRMRSSYFAGAHIVRYHAVEKTGVDAPD